MYLFLYQAARHSNERWGNRSRYSQSSKRGDFNLELLRRSIGGRYEILGHGEHPFQAALNKIDLADELYGHIVSIEEARNAVWFKLNYDQVIRGSTKYIGAWKPLDAAAIEPNIQEYKALKDLHSKLTTVFSQLKYHVNREYDFKTFLSKHDFEFCEKAHESLDAHTIRMAMLRDEAEREVKRVKGLMDDEQQKVRDYLKSQKL